jgi:hypothetical protein
MAASSMFHSNPNAESRTAPSSPFSLNALHPVKSHDFKAEENIKSLFPKALASHSMIDMNSTSTTRRAAFGGKLDSMARKITTTFQ